MVKKSKIWIEFICESTYFPFLFTLIYSTNVLELYFSSLPSLTAYHSWSCISLGVEVWRHQQNNNTASWTSLSKVLNLYCGLVRMSKCVFTVFWGGPCVWLERYRPKPELSTKNGEKKIRLPLSPCPPSMFWWAPVPLTKHICTQNINSFFFLPFYGFAIFFSLL